MQIRRVLYLGFITKNELSVQLVGHSILDEIVIRVELVFLVLDLRRPQGLSIEHNFLVQDFLQEKDVQCGK
jgi:hypothetical protein